MENLFSQIRHKNIVQDALQFMHYLKLISLAMYSTYIYLYKTIMMKMMIRNIFQDLLNIYQEKKIINLWVPIIIII